MDKITQGLKYIKSQLDYTVPQHIPIAERWREGRFAFIAVINAPYIFNLINIDGNIISLVCWILIIAISVIILFDKDKDNKNHMNISAGALRYFYDANHEGFSLIESNQDEVDKWYERVVLCKENYKTATKLNKRLKKRKKFIKRFKMWRNIATSVLAIAILNKFGEDIMKMESIWPTWLFDLVKF